jgi:hypothetical protein
LRTSVEVTNLTDKYYLLTSFDSPEPVPAVPTASLVDRAVRDHGEEELTHHSRS